MFLERESSLAELRACWEGACNLAGCIALVGGDAGIGKTTLLQAFVASLPKARVLWGGCDALITPRPFAPLHDMARQSSPSLRKALADGAGRDATFSAVLDELETPATLAIFEDMHWADEATLDLVKYVGRRIQRTRSMIVISYRHDEVGTQHPLRAVIGELPRAGTRRMVVPALSENAVHSMAIAAGRPAEGLHGMTGGNALFVAEVLAADADAVPPTVKDAVLARAARLEAQPRSLLEFLSVIPGRAEVWLAEAADPAVGVIDACVDTGLVRHEAGLLFFRHELVRRALEDSLSPGRLRALHAQVLALLSGREGIPPARLSHHASAAGDASQTLHHAPLAAAQAAQLGAHRQAVSHLQSALAFAAQLPREPRARLHESLAYECYLTNQIERAVEQRRVALAIWQGLNSRLQEGDTLRWLSRLSWFIGRRAEAIGYGREAVAVLECLPPGPELAMAYSNRAQLHMLAHETEDARIWARRAIDIAKQLGNPEILCHALNNLGTAQVLDDDAAGWSDLEASLALGLAHGFQEHVARAYTNLCSCAIVLRDYARAAPAMEAGLAYCRERDLDSWHLYMLAWRARLHLEQGRWEEAATDADAVLRQRQAAPVSRAPALIALGHLRVRRGDPDAHAVLEEARGLAGGIDEVQRFAPLAVAMAEAAWLAGDLPTMRRELAPVLDAARARSNQWVCGELSVWLWRAKALDCPPARMAPPCAMEIGGDWRGAADAWRELGCPYERALVLGWHGGEAEQREALELFAELGAAPAAEALRRHMRARGVRSVPRGVRATTQQHPQGLTKREAQILQLMKAGHRNAAIAKRLFLSTRTVDHHVSAILAKLGVSSRIEAIAQDGEPPESSE